MTPKVVDALNRQISTEFAASFSYLAMAAWCDRHRFTGAGRWLRLQGAEEHVHAMKLFDFVLARDRDVSLEALPKPATDYASLVDVFERALEQERKVSRQIDKLYELAFQEKVFAAMAEMQWFITEQVEEEKTVRELVTKLQMVKDDPSSLLDLDRELGARQAPA